MIITNEQLKIIEDNLGQNLTDQLIQIFDRIEKRINEQKIEIKTDLLLELATKANLKDLETTIRILEGNFKKQSEELKGEFKILAANNSKEISELKNEIKKLETDSKKDLKELQGDIKILEANSRGDIDDLQREIIKDIESLKFDIQDFTGELQHIRSLIKLLIVVGFIGMALFSPIIQQVITILLK